MNHQQSAAVEMDAHPRRFAAPSDPISAKHPQLSLAHTTSWCSTESEEGTTGTDSQLVIGRALLGQSALAWPTQIGRAIVSPRGELPAPCWAASIRTAFSRLGSYVTPRYERLTLG